MKISVAKKYNSCAATIERTTEIQGTEAMTV